MIEFIICQVLLEVLGRLYSETISRHELSGNSAVILIDAILVTFLMNFSGIMPTGQANFRRQVRLIWRSANSLQK